MSRPTADQLVVSHRYCGPPGSGNGGYVAGLLADRLTYEGAALVSLLRPPPLDVPMDVRHEGATVSLEVGGDTVARCLPARTAVAALDPVPHEEAVRASAGYPGHTLHPFPTCFGCGTERPDGLRIFPGAVRAGADGSNRVAAPWTPGPEPEDPTHAQRASRAVTWSALDCIGGWAGGIAERTMVLGQMTALLDELPLLGEPHVVVGQSRGSEGRKTYTSSTLYDAAGQVVARADHIWISVDPAVFNRARS